MESMIVRTERLKKYYRLGAGTVKALDGIDFCVKEGEFVAVTGKSGSGKTTLLQMLGGLDRPTSGTVHVDGKNLAEMSKDSLTVFRRRKVGFIFQNYNLVPDLTVYENVVFPIELDGAYIDRDYIERILFMLKLQKKTEALPHMISGGEQQRAAIARALATKPSIILADEPTGNLDTVASHDVLGLLKMAAEEFRQTIVLITHDQDIAQMADRIVRIEDGRIVKGCGMDAGE
ncbi:ABC transporter ATP-binding protein [Bariatricus massiliensis]|uniref:ABC transporter ATP-binding protein n=1 Tax=Bariatricus massiliensis TaxID=1745713 RepID=A0ABS8DBY1_9FIRM|nr:ABC transporter ATP-binding protein [Bariatricus massiliensis]MCB7303832.1 ABC transporter ATP-binding protein [Bariatricus massiliensis]MCB7373248.1 ABC transporter ATP-binding protein [Bariatricus massiliensis]MCB7385918.1 ABC transporter ATP-binding protein [Bariatricus massiliensis]MCB7410080.1 ABC transporter ATP-binding protein [Bariatricus massiliensis]MCQ5252952.1 ABC transporter ATP-binding protein [Bariatricus massiliensis]